jgi:acetate kinase
MSEGVLAINVGSSSIKFALYGTGVETPLLRGQVESIGSDPSFGARGELAEALGDARVPANGGHAGAIDWLVGLLGSRIDVKLRAIGHRIVHGGMRHVAPERIDGAVIESLQLLVPLAPDHQPAGLAAVRAVAQRWPELPQVACYDTAFHARQPRLARLFALPREMADEGIVRYGFHGLSYEYIAGALPGIAAAQAQGRVVVAHLGHGASLCAMRHGRSESTSMGFSVIDGLVMGQRSGRIDPGVLLYLMQQKGWSAAEVADLLLHRSGLLGVSGISEDVRDLEASDRPEAAEALDLFAWRAGAEIAGMASAIEGLDALVFTGGIGEHSVAMRARIAARCGGRGVALDEAANARGASAIHAAGARVGVYVVPTDEEVVIARATRAVVGLDS